MPATSEQLILALNHGLPMAPIKTRRRGKRYLLPGMRLDRDSGQLIAATVDDFLREWSTALAP